jgi:AcrR family transcriptional regulator
VSTTETGSRVQRKRGRRMQEIVAVAAELFGERGYDAVSLDDVAERLDVTKGSLYHYFSGKEELGSAAIETLGTAWTDRLAALVERVGGPPAARLRVLVREQLIVAVRDHPAGLGLFLVPDDWPEAQRAVIKELRRRHDRLFRDVVEEGVAAGEFVVVDVDTTLNCLHAAMTQASVWYRGLRGARLDHAVDRLAATLMMLVGERPGQEAAASSATPG